LYLVGLLHVQVFQSVIREQRCLVSITAAASDPVAVLIGMLPVLAGMLAVLAGMIEAKAIERLGCFATRPHADTFDTGSGTAGGQAGSWENYLDPEVDTNAKVSETSLCKVRG
jgi:hypothetical protein